MRYAVRIIENKKRVLSKDEYAKVMVADFVEEFDAPSKQAARKLARAKYPDSFRYQFGQVWLRKSE